MSSYRFVFLVFISLVFGDPDGPRWIEHAKLVGLGGVGTQYQGERMATNNAGNVLVISGPGDNGFMGAVWTWLSPDNGTTWNQQGAKLVGTGGISSSFGPLDLSDGGDILAVGGPSDNNHTGATWIFQWNFINNNWTQIGTKLVGTDGTGAHQGCGVSLNGNGTILAVGGYGDSANTGAVWIFTNLNRANWEQDGNKLIPNDASATANFGYSVEISSDGLLLAIGGFQDSNNFGAVWIFARGADTWIQQGSKLVPNNNAGNSPQFGFSLSFPQNATTLVIGGNQDDDGIGACWIFIQNQTTNLWVQSAKLVGTGSDGLPSQGSSVKISGDGKTVAAGGGGDNNRRGAVWLFGYNQKTGSWQQMQDKLVGEGSGSISSQGDSVTLNYDASIVGVGGSLDMNIIGASWVFLKSSDDDDDDGEDAGKNKVGLTLGIIIAIILFFILSYVFYRSYQKRKEGGAYDTAFGINTTSAKSPPLATSSNDDVTYQRMK